MKVSIESDRLRVTAEIHGGTCTTSSVVPIPEEFQHGKARAAIDWVVDKIKEATDG